MPDNDFEKKKAEYNAAQEMLRHYDTLNWQIGSILIGAITVFTGLVLQDKVIELVKESGVGSWFLVLGIPAFSFFVLLIWFLWFRRHRDLYNFRNETIHRLELDLHMYHYLRVIETVLTEQRDAARDRGNTEEAESKERDLDRLETAKTEAHHAGAEFRPFFPAQRLSGPSGFALSKILMIGMPAFQLILFLGIKLT
jgi:hypothetical protein